MVFRDNDVTNRHTTICFLLGSIEWGRARGTVIEHNRIHNCGEMPPSNHHHGIYVEASDRARITGNWIYDNADRGVQLFPDAQNTYVAGNVIDGNGQGVVFSRKSSNNVVENNVLSNPLVRYNIESFELDRQRQRRAAQLRVEHASLGQRRDPVGRRDPRSGQSRDGTRIREPRGEGLPPAAGQPVRDLHPGPGTAPAGTGEQEAQAPGPPESQRARAVARRARAPARVPDAGGRTRGRLAAGRPQGSTAQGSGAASA